MKKILLFFALASVASFLASCGDKKSIIEPGGTPPSITSLSVQRNSLSIDSLNLSPLLVNGKATVSLTLQAGLQSPENPATSVSAFLLSPTGETELATTSVAGSSASSLTIPFTFTLDQNNIGDYTIAVVAQDDFGQSGSNARKKIRFFRFNTPPVLQSVSAPDTVLIPAAGDFVFKITASTTDAEGVNDITNVVATRQDNASTFSLLDNGDAAGLSGDLVAGDGIFTATLQVPFSNTPATRVFDYQATDRSGAKSNLITKSIVFIK
ncbi:MAG: hypothetical protein IAF08_03215 [Rhizobacter sp.]|nr:hypothetical protein [Chlorobiales bacterium]